MPSQTAPLGRSLTRTEADQLAGTVQLSYFAARTPDVYAAALRNMMPRDSSALPRGPFGYVRPVVPSGFTLHVKQIDGGFAKVGAVHKNRHDVLLAMASETRRAHATLTLEGN